MGNEQYPKWIQELDYEELSFIYRFLLASGSLKELAKEYEISNPLSNGQLVFVFMITNIGTLLFVLISFFVKKADELNHSKIMDL